MRVVLTAAFAIAFAVLSAASATASKAIRDRPNVVMIMTDDQDFRSMWAMPKTRKLIGHRGTTFKTTVANYPLCGPSRATMLTGQVAHNHDVLWNDAPEGGYSKLRGGETLPVWLHRAGYRTIHIGKYENQYGESDPYEIPPGWTDWHGSVDPSTYDYYGYTINDNGHLHTYGHSPADYSTDVYSDIAARRIRIAAKKNRPFFLNLAPNAPHTVAADVEARIEGTPALPAPRDAKRFADAPLPRYPDFNEIDISDKPPALNRYFPNLLTDDEIASLRDHYRGRMGSLLAVDDMVSRVIRTLKRQRVYRDTVVIFTSDNGWILGEHRLRDPVTSDGRAAGVKYVAYEGSSRVPLMISGPGFPRRKTVHGVATNVDLAPTILDIADARRKAKLRLDGESLRKAARKPKRLRGRAALIETAPNPRGVPAYKSIRTQRYRLDLGEGGDVVLFDLRRDPWEMQSVDADPRYSRVKAVLLRKLARLSHCQGRSCLVKVRPLTPGKG